ncbi:MAG: LuxR C-terminal-related transcriptional regulator [Anaerolineae bacterium]|jgi:DNA-binding NarL/FixJ family response regulator|nr:LuxR C-terminal-related transcriptional regulator [Anaerolineae bacterium]
MDDPQNHIKSEKTILADQIESLLMAQLHVILSQATIYQHTFAGHQQALLAMTVLINLIQQTIYTTQDIVDALKITPTPSATLPAHIHLTPRELDVIKDVVEGMSNKEIAHHLGMTIRTVKFHLDNIFSKFGVTSRTGVAMFAVQYRLV